MELASKADEDLCAGDQMARRGKHFHKLNQ